MTDISDAAASFATHYCQMFDNSRDELASFYKEQSKLSFLSEQFHGSKAIMDKLTPFQKTQHVIHTCDAQPTPFVQGGLLVAVTGEVLIDGEEHPVKFAQTLQLVPEESSYWIANDIHQLV